MRNTDRLPYSRDNMLSLLCTCGNGDNAALQTKVAWEFQGDQIAAANSVSFECSRLAKPT